MLLLDRSRISQKNDGWQDANGAVYVIFPIEDLAAALHRSSATVKTALSALERAGLIVRQRRGTGRANHLFVRIPEHSLSAITQSQIQPPDSEDAVSHTARNPATNNNYLKNNHVTNKQGERPSTYGEYKNVLLTDQDIQELEAALPNYRDYIEALSEYMASTGRRYKNHAATIKSWARRDQAKKPAQYRHSNYRFKEGDSL